MISRCSFFLILSDFQTLQSRKISNFLDKKNIGAFIGIWTNDLSITSVWSKWKDPDLNAVLAYIFICLKKC